MKKYFKMIFVLLFQLIMISPACFAENAVERPIDKVYYENGDLFSQTNLFSDRNNGFYYTYYHNGQLATMAIYHEGKEIADRAFDEEGRELNRNGIFKTYYADGTVASSGPYRNDLKNGEFKFYFYDGVTVVDVWHYWKGTKVGEHIRNDQSGKLVYTEDLGYPSAYVQEQKNIIMVLSALLFLFFFGFISYREKKA